MPIDTCRTIIDALGLCVEPKELALLVVLANHAYAIGNTDEYHNQCDAIAKFFNRSN